MTDILVTILQDVRDMFPSTLRREEKSQLKPNFVGYVTIRSMFIVKVLTRSIEKKTVSLQRA